MSAVLCQVNHGKMFVSSVRCDALVGKARKRKEVNIGKHWCAQTVPHSNINSEASLNDLDLEEPPEIMPWFNETSESLTATLDSYALLWFLLDSV